MTKHLPMIAAFLAVPLGFIALAYGSTWLYTRSGKFAVINAGLGLAWYVVILAVYICQRLVARIYRPTRNPYAVVFLIALAVRLIGAMLVVRGANFDIEGFKNAADLVESGQDIYLNPNGWPYLPLPAYFANLMNWLSILVGLPFSMIVKIPMIIADSLTALISSALSCHYFDQNDRRYHMLDYALNPVAIWVSAYHGQFDSIAMFLMVLSYWALSSRESIPLGRGFGGVFLGLAVAFKTWPIIYLPFFVQRIGRIKDQIVYGLTCILVIILVVGTYLFRVPSANWEAVLNYRPAASNWGYFGLLKLIHDIHLFDVATILDIVARMGPVLILVGLGSFFLWAWRAPLGFALTSAVAIFYATSTAIAFQYLVWIVPLAILSNEAKWLRTYSILCVPSILILDFGVNIYGVIHYGVAKPEVIYAMVALFNVFLWMFVVARAAKGYQVVAELKRGEA